MQEHCFSGTIHKGPRTFVWGHFVLGHTVTPPNSLALLLLCENITADVAFSENK